VSVYSLSIASNNPLGVYKQHHKH